MTAYRHPMTKAEIVEEMERLKHQWYTGKLGYSDMLRNIKDLDKKLMERAWAKALNKEARKK